MTGKRHGGKLIPARQNMGSGIGWWIKMRGRGELNRVKGRNKGVSWESAYKLTWLIYKYMIKYRGIYTGKYPPRGELTVVIGGGGGGYEKTKRKGGKGKIEKSNKKERKRKKGETIREKGK
jgi:hypothetical protein